MEAHTYEVDLAWQHDRLGKLSSPVLRQTLEVATPPEFPKGMPGIWSPEHLLVAAVSSCLMTTFLAIAENSKLAFEQFDCRAVGTLETVEGRWMVSEVRLFPTVVVAHPNDLEKAGRVLAKAEKACLISNSVRSQITMNPVFQTAVLSDSNPL
ncbi:OsmC family protein [Tellurirhabdus rosea]|uniref:OsmC family protein n=1 Tax=Tellurirhabdus rosea TaxID=2674997 RepID=UPI0022587695|nr:OsmC family protein [Tellurirhabdus rosea]